MSGVVDGDQYPLAATTRLPAPNDKAIPRPVTVPGLRTLKQTPLAIHDGRTAQNRKQILVEQLQHFIDRLMRRTNQVRRDAFSPPLELTLVKEPQAG